MSHQDGSPSLVRSLQQLSLSLQPKSSWFRIFEELILPVYSEEDEAQSQFDADSLESSIHFNLVSSGRQDDSAALKTLRSRCSHNDPVLEVILRLVDVNKLSKGWNKGSGSLPSAVNPQQPRDVLPPSLSFGNLPKLPSLPRPIDMVASLPVRPCRLTLQQQHSKTSSSPSSFPLPLSLPLLPPPDRPFNFLSSVLQRQAAMDSGAKAALPTQQPPLPSQPAQLLQSFPPAAAPAIAPLVSKAPADSPPSALDWHTRVYQAIDDFSALCRKENAFDPVLYTYRTCLFLFMRLWEARNLLVGETRKNDGAAAQLKQRLAEAQWATEMELMVAVLQRLIARAQQQPLHAVVVLDSLYEELQQLAPAALAVSSTLRTSYHGGGKSLARGGVRCYLRWTLQKCWTVWVLQLKQWLMSAGQGTSTQGIDPMTLPRMLVDSLLALGAPKMLFHFLKNDHDTPQHMVEHLVRQSKEVITLMRRSDEKAFHIIQTLIQGLPLALIANFSELRLTSFRSSALLSWSKDTLREYFVEHSEGRGLYGDGPLGWDWQDLIEGSTAPKALSKERKAQLAAARQRIADEEERKSEKRRQEYQQKQQQRQDLLQQSEAAAALKRRAQREERAADLSSARAATEELGSPARVTTGYGGQYKVTRQEAIEYLLKTYEAEKGLVAVNRFVRASTDAPSSPQRLRTSVAIRRPAGEGNSAREAIYGSGEGSVGEQPQQRHAVDHSSSGQNTAPRYNVRVSQPPGGRSSVQAALYSVPEDVSSLSEAEDQGVRERKRESGPGARLQEGTMVESGIHDGNEHSSSEVTVEGDVVMDAATAEATENHGEEGEAEEKGGREGEEEQEDVTSVDVHMGSSPPTGGEEGDVHMEGGTPPHLQPRPSPAILSSLPSTATAEGGGGNGKPRVAMSLDERLRMEASADAGQSSMESSSQRPASARWNPAAASQRTIGNALLSLSDGLEGEEQDLLSWWEEEKKASDADIPLHATLRDCVGAPLSNLFLYIQEAGAAFLVGRGRLMQYLQDIKDHMLLGRGHVFTTFLRAAMHRMAGWKRYRNLQKAVPSAAAATHGVTTWWSSQTVVDGMWEEALEVGTQAEDNGSAPLNSFSYAVPSELSSDIDDDIWSVHALDDLTPTLNLSPEAKVVISDANVAEYQRIHSLLMLLQRGYIEAKHVWMESRMASPPLWVSLLIRDVLHFQTCILHHFNHYVHKVAWRHLTRNLQRCKSISALTAAHNEFVTDISKRLFLSFCKDLEVVYALSQSVLDCCSSISALLHSPPSDSHSQSILQRIADARRRFLSHASLLVNAGATLQQFEFLQEFVELLMFQGKFHTNIQGADVAL